MQANSMRFICCLILFTVLACNGSAPSSTTDSDASATSDGSDSDTGSSDSDSGTSDESSAFTCSFCYETDTTTKSEVGVLTVGLCERLFQCDSDTAVNACLFYANSDTALITAAGSNSGTYGTFQALQAAIDAGDVTQSLVSYANCNNAMPSIACSAFTAAVVYNATTGVYAGFSAVMPAACTDIF